MKHRQIIFGFFGPADEQVTKAVEPRVRSFHHPATGFFARFLRLFFFATRSDVGRIAECRHDLPDLGVGVARIQAQVRLLARCAMGLLGRVSGRGQTGQRAFCQLHVVPVGPVQDQADGQPARFD